ncbi:hypothetical protein [Quadrisphaera setariae]|uniref:Uncharacterized protein n=1 Tax=Quadrisphaera setariae TaxID=2593304 RepID=A0A5C8ZJW4_9ACTN|nr:hypothetical protein [Quadrisphaera setariae]TXR57421.1 hypothetical protein FMM08_03995 [Quadrisphaera setariae]
MIAPQPGQEAPTAPAPVQPRLRRSASLIAVGVALLACQQVLGPVISFQVFASAESVSDDSSTAFTTAFFTVFGVGLVLLVVGLHRFASHVHALAVSAQHR